MTQPNYQTETITSIHTWIPNKLLSIECTNTYPLKYQAGQFARLGLKNKQGDIVWRAFSMTSHPDDPHLGFYMIIIPDGEFSTLLKNIQAGDEILVDHQSFGYLTIDQFPQGGDLWLLGTGTGLSAYISLLKDDATWDRFDHIVLAHGVRTVEELTYQDFFDTLKEKYSNRFSYLPLPTREAYQDYPQARLNTLLEDGRLSELSHISLNPDRSCIFLCGNPEMISDTRKLLKPMGFKPTRRGVQGNLAVEKYW